MIPDFHAYEKNLCVTCLLPLLARLGVALDGKSVLDVGCGYGGVLAGLGERFRLREALGIDLDPEMIRVGREKCQPEVRLDNCDFFALEGGVYDLILMRDVLEHIVNVERALAKAAALLNPGGIIYATFAPFYGPFGGHQHNGAGLFSRLPWVQFLPEGVLRRLLRFPGNSYKSATELAADMDSVLRTRLTLARFRRGASKAGLGIRYHAQYLVRPDYRLKFGLPALRFPGIPAAEELLCTGAEAMLSRK